MNNHGTCITRREKEVEEMLKEIKETRDLKTEGG
jgi:hypothetical protein